MALKTVWIVPRWSGRLERGGYVKEHDPEVSKAPTRRSCGHDMTSYLYTLRIQLDCKHSWYRWHEFQSCWIVNQEFEARKETKQSLVLTRSWMWSGSELVVVVVWIGSGSVWIRVWIGPEVDSHVCVCCSLDAAWQEKDDKVCRQQVCSLAAGLLDCLAA